MSIGHPAVITPVATPRPTARRSGRPSFWLIVVLALGAVAAGAAWELRTSTLQSFWIARWASRLTYRVEPGKSRELHFSAPSPATGPYDMRLGYARILIFSDRLAAKGFEIRSQARFSPELLDAARRGLTPPYHEKEGAGLRLLAAGGEPLFSFDDPSFRYESFEDVPDLLLRSLLYVENRELLITERPFANPAIEWDRLARAALDLGGQQLGATGNVPGGSTLATQIEKYRHSPRGLTANPLEKLRQIASATVRSYAESRDTTSLRRRLAVSYLNTLPLSATPGWGEVFGVGDGLRAYYGADPAHASTLLRERPSSPSDVADRGLAYRQALSLLLSARRPTGLLRGPNETALMQLTASYMRRMSADGVITPELRDAALAADLHFAGARRDMEAVAADKGISRMRTWLGETLGASPYELDRLDLTVTSTLDAKAQTEVTRRLRDLASPAVVKRLGLRQKHTLASGDPGGVVYAFTLYEQTSEGNLLRVHSDSLGSELDVNDGIKLDLGSTAKLRTLVSYLDIVAELHADHAGQSRDALRAGFASASDPLTRFALGQLAANPELPLQALLDAAMERRYSASPAEGFFTGGGVHHFANFDKTDNLGVLTLREAFRRSVNLPFVRLMSDIVRFETARLAIGETRETRDAALRRFVDQEGRAQLAQWQRAWRNSTPDQILAELVARGAPTPRRVATILRAIHPSGDPVWFAPELTARSPRASELSAAAIAKLYDDFGPERLGLADRGWVAKLQPLELWLAGQLWQNPQISSSQVIAMSQKARQDAAEWLFKTRNEHARERRLAELREQDAFVRIHERWARLGYPFESLVPSYATAIGSSADRPAALAELMGIIASGGVRLPQRRVETLAFAAGTPYETNFAPAPARRTGPVRVLNEAVAHTVRDALGDVVAKGTARRIASTFAAADGSPIPIAGKTGTGDHRFKTFAAGGALTSERVLNRSAVFAFLIGERYFGVVTAYVAGPSAAEYHFTSTLPLEVLRVLSSALAPLVGAAPAPAGADGLAASPDGHLDSDLT